MVWMSSVMSTIAYFEGFVRNQAISECPPLLILKVLLDINHFCSIFSFWRKHGSHSLGFGHRTVMRVKKNNSSTPVCPKVDKIFITPLLSAWHCGPKNQIQLVGGGGWGGAERHTPNRLFIKGVGLSLLCFHFCLFSCFFFFFPFRITWLKVFQI